MNNEIVSCLDKFLKKVSENLKPESVSGHHKNHQYRDLVWEQELDKLLEHAINKNI